VCCLRSNTGGPHFARPSHMASYRTIDNADLLEFFNVVEDVETVREHDTVAYMEQPEDAEPGWMR
jgi:hypothetical protein